MPLASDTHSIDKEGAPRTKTESSERDPKSITIREPFQMIGGTLQMERPVL